MTREDKYISFFSNLTEKNIDQIADYFTHNAHFKDPFNDVIGIDAIKTVFSHMFETTENPTFIVSHHAANQNILMLQWTFQFSKKGKNWTVEGSSLVTFNDSDLVIEHIDYWDPAEQIYSKIGLLRPIMNFLKNRLTAS